MLDGGEQSGVKELQACKIRELADTLVMAGFTSLDGQAAALGLSRSTTWTILKAKHKNYGLSAALIKRVLAKPDLNQRIRDKFIEYVLAKAAGSYGHNGTQLRRFTQLLARIPVADVHALELDKLEGRRTMRRATDRH